MPKQVHRVRAQTVDIALWRDPKTGLTVALLQNDHGTPERARHQGGVSIVARRVNHGGIITGFGAKAIYENVLEELIALGAIGRGKDLQVRMYAVDWIRRVYARAALPRRLIGKYEPPTSKSQDDPMANPVTLFYRAQWNSVFSELRPLEARAVVRATCFDEWVGRGEWGHLARGLDRIVKWQGLDRPARKPNDKP